MRTLATLAWRNMWRNWRRTAIAMTAIVLGMVLLLFVDGLILGSDQAIFGNAVRLYGGNVQVHAPGYKARANRMPLYPLVDAASVVAAARQLPQVVAAGQRIQTGGLASNGSANHGVAITGVEPEVEAGISIVAENMAEGRYLSAEDGDAVVIGRGLAELLGVSVGQRIMLLGRGRNDALRQRGMTVVGIYDLGMREAEERMVFITLPEAQTLYRLRDQATEVAITLQRIGQEPAALAAVQAALPGYEVDSWATLKPEMRQTIDTKATFSGFFGLVVLFIACIGILNLMLMAVFERTREMGVLAALGMKGRQVTTLFLLEGTMIGALGAFIGCLVGAALVWAVAQVGLDMSYASGMGEITALMGERLYPSLSLTQTIGRGLTVTLIAALATLYPAWQASRKQPADVLHHV
jgi:ABC-type lipoprotein release transport system permease subunit